MSTTINDLNLPRSGLIAAAEDWVRSIEPRFLVNHSVRTYVFGRAVGQGQGLQPGVDYDDEVLFLGCLLHDVGLTEQGDRDQRFEVDGADLAVQFLLGNGYPPDRADIVWDAIALHSTPGIPGRKRPEIALLQAGTSIDILGGPNDLPPGMAERTHHALPRLGVQNAFRDAVLAYSARKPSKSPPYAFPGELVRQCIPGAAIPTYDDGVARSGWDE